MIDNRSSIIHRDTTKSIHKNHNTVLDNTVHSLIAKTYFTITSSNEHNHYFLFSHYLTDLFLHNMQNCPVSFTAWNLFDLNISSLRTVNLIIYNLNLYYCLASPLLRGCITSYANSRQWKEGENGTHILKCYIFLAHWWIYTKPSESERVNCSPLKRTRVCFCIDLFTFLHIWNEKYFNALILIYL